MENPFALLSVLNKDRIEELGGFLIGRGYELLSTGGTAERLEKAGLAVFRVEDYTGFPEMLDGRVKMLHPKVFAGIMSRRTEADARETAPRGIRPIGIVVVNLYDFKGETAKSDTIYTADKNTDVGGPSAVAAAAKNWLHATVTTHPDEYSDVMANMDVHGNTTKEFRYAQKRKALNMLADYARMIADFHDRHCCED